MDWTCSKNGSGEES